MTALQFWDRHSPSSLLYSDSETDSSGRIFVSRAGMFDLSAITLLAATVDTVRQLYVGKLRQDSYQKLHDSLEAGESVFEGYAISRMSKASGYRYKLQNNENGIVVLIGSYFVRETDEGSHLKIELSPHYIAVRGYQSVQANIDRIASIYLDDFKPSGCAVHLALDVQGWDLPSDFDDNFVTRSRVRRSYEGIVENDFSDLSSVAVRYGRGNTETITFGKADSLQTCLYRKDLEIIHSDKVDYFRAVWFKNSLGNYQEDKPVMRLEMRVHHSIVRDIGNGMGQELESYQQLAPFLTDIWRYALTCNRLHFSKRYIAPVWQLFIQDVEFIYPSKGLKISRLKRKDVSAVGKNISMIIGNLITMGARQGFKTAKLMTSLKLLFIWPDIIKYYKDRGLTESDLREQIDKGLSLRRLMGHGVAYGLVLEAA